jgi:hypothetical protein
MKPKLRALKRIIILTASCLLMSYMGSYYVRTIEGEYVPGGFSSWGVTHFTWAPKGMVDPETHRWSRSFQYFYYPLLILDWKIWHTFEEGFESDAAKEEKERIKKLENQTGQ